MHPVVEFRSRLAKLIRLFGMIQTFRFALGWRAGKQRMRMRVIGCNLPMWIRPRTTDINCLWQIFGNFDAQLPVSLNPRYILDGGANVGYASIFYAHAFPNATIVAVEPELGNLEILKLNETAYPQVHVLHGGLWSSTKRLEIANPEGESWAFTLTEAQSPNTYSVQGFSIEDVMQRYEMPHIDVLKLDIEGGEEELFNYGYERWIEGVKNIVIEIHGEKARDSIIKAIDGKGFTVRNQGEKVIFSRDSLGIEFE